MLQLIYELRKNCCGRVDGTGRDGTGKSKVLQEVLADLKIHCILYHLWTSHRPEPQCKDQYHKVARTQKCKVKLLKTQYQEQRDGQVGEKIPPVPKLKGVLLNKYICKGHIFWIHTFPVSFVPSKVPGCKGCKVPSKVPWPAPSLLLLLILGPLLP